MDKLVKYPPINPGEYAYVSYYALGLIPVRIVVSKRIDGWCAYCLLKHMPQEYYVAYRDAINEPTSWERVRNNGDKIPGSEALELFPEMGEDYAY